MNLSLFNLLDTGTTTGSTSWYSIIMIVGMFVLLYFLMIRPQKKKEKQQRDMRNNIEIGDGVTTIGGIVGRVTGIKDDTIVIETGSDRTRLRFQKWAISEVEKLKLDETGNNASQ